MKSGKCLFNKKALRESSKCICYHCLKDFDQDEMYITTSEELKCPYCNKKAVLPIDELNNISFYWAAKIGKITYG